MEDYANYCLEDLYYLAEKYSHSDDGYDELRFWAVMDEIERRHDLYK